MHDSIDHLIELREEKDGTLTAQHNFIIGKEASRIPVVAKRTLSLPILVQYESISFGGLGNPVALLPVPVPSEADAIVIGDLVDRGPRATATFYKIEEFKRRDDLHESITSEYLQKRENYSTADKSTRGDPRTY